VVGLLRGTAGFLLRRNREEVKTLRQGLIDDVGQTEVYLERAVWTSQGREFCSRMIDTWEGTEVLALNEAIRRVLALQFGAKARLI